MKNKLSKFFLIILMCSALIAITFSMSMDYSTWPLYKKIITILTVAVFIFNTIHSFVDFFRKNDAESIALVYADLVNNPYRLINKRLQISYDIIADDKSVSRIQECFLITEVFHDVAAKCIKMEFSIGYQMSSHIIVINITDSGNTMEYHRDEDDSEKINLNNTELLLFV